MTRTWSVAQAEWLDGEVHVGGLRNVELVVQRADGPVILREEAALHVSVMPILETLKNRDIIRSMRQKSTKNEGKSSKKGG